MITENEMEMFIDGIWEPPYCFHQKEKCAGDSCPIEIGGKNNDKD